MKTKSLFWGVLFSLLTAALVAIMLIFSQRYLLNDNNNAKAAPLFFNRDTPYKTSFVEVKNIVINLKNYEGRERYVLLELALSTTTPKNKTLTMEDLPAVRSSTVNLLSNADFQEIHNLPISELRRRLMEAYQRDLQTMNIQVPFENVIISKIVFQ